MERKTLLDSKRILIVDDEPDVLATLRDLLHMCDLEEATTFDRAKELLETKHFDIAILDIMGVDGFELLEIANRKKIKAVMLTAHALTPESIVKSYKKGAASFLPKDKMADITTFLNDILEADQKGKDFWWRWLERTVDYWDSTFGPDWQNRDKKFWEKFRSYT